MKRYVYLGVALGLTLTLGTGFVASCYRIPTPICGFRCGLNGECPTEYTCSSFEDRCHLTHSDPSIRCDTVDDSPPDAPDAAIDAPVDTPIDAAIDAAVDAPTD